MITNATALRTGRKFDQVPEGPEATLHSYFPDERRRFMAVVSSECAGIANPTQATADVSDAAPQVMRTGAVQFTA